MGRLVVWCRLPAQIGCGGWVGVEQIQVHRRGIKTMQPCCNVGEKVSSNLSSNQSQNVILISGAIGKTRSTLLA